MFDYRYVAVKWHDPKCILWGPPSSKLVNPGNSCIYMYLLLKTIIYHSCELLDL